jgi:hypothetical protein
MCCSTGLCTYKHTTVVEHDMEISSLNNWLLYVCIKLDLEPLCWCETVLVITCGSSWQQSRANPNAPGPKPSTGHRRPDTR